MSDRSDRLKGPIIRWLDYGTEGWQPDSFATIKDALEAERHTSFVITKRVDFDVIEKIQGEPE